MNQTPITDPILRKITADLKEAREHLGLSRADGDAEMYLAVEALMRAIASVAHAIDLLSQACDFEP